MANTTGAFPGRPCPVAGPDCVGWEGNLGVVLSGKSGGSVKSPAGQKKRASFRLFPRLCRFDAEVGVTDASYEGGIDGTSLREKRSILSQRVESSSFMIDGSNRRGTGHRAVVLFGPESCTTLPPPPVPRVRSTVERFDGIIVNAKVSFTRRPFGTLAKSTRPTAVLDAKNFIIETTFPCRRTHWQHPRNASTEFARREIFPM